MNFRKGRMLYILVVLLVATSLSGCRMKEAPKKAEDFSGIELTYYKVFDGSDVMEPFIDDYIAKHPGLKINYRMFSDFDEYQRVILNEMAEGEGPDIFSMPNTWFLSNYRKVNPLPLEVGTPDAFAATFVDVASKDLVRPDQNGVKKIYALPMTVDTLALYYNKSHFEDALPEKGRPSSTWEGIKEDVIALNKEDNSFGRFERSGIALGRADNISRAVDILYLMMLQHGTKFYNSDITKAIFAGRQDNFPGLKALELFASFSDPNKKHYSWNEYIVDDDTDGMEIEAFAAGKVSMIVGFSYTRDAILNQISLLNSRGEKSIDKSDIRIAQIPQLYDPKVSSQKRVTYGSYFAETVSRNSQYPEIAWDFLLELTSKENLAQYFEETHKPTSRRDMIEDQKKDANYGIFASQIGFSESFPILDYYTYKDAFSESIRRANENGAAGADISYAQDKVNELIPAEGVLPEVKKNENN